MLSLSPQPALPPTTTAAGTAAYTAHHPLPSQHPLPLPPALFQTDQRSGLPNLGWYAFRQQCFGSAPAWQFPIWLGRPQLHPVHPTVHPTLHCLQNKRTPQRLRQLAEALQTRRPGAVLSGPANCAIHGAVSVPAVDRKGAGRAAAKNGSAAGVSPAPPRGTTPPAAAEIVASAAARLGSTPGRRRQLLLPAAASAVGWQGLSAQWVAPSWVRLLQPSWTRLLWGACIQDHASSLLHVAGFRGGPCRHAGLWPGGDAGVAGIDGACAPGLPAMPCHACILVLA